MSSTTKSTLRQRGDSHHRKEKGTSGEMNGIQNAMQAGAGRVKMAVSEAAGEVLGSLKAARSKARKRAVTRFERVREVAADYVRERKSQAQEAEVAIERKIREQPLTSVLVAAGLGFLAGVIWRRCR